MYKKIMMIWPSDCLKEVAARSSDLINEFLITVTPIYINIFKNMIPSTFFLNMKYNNQ